MQGPNALAWLDAAPDERVPVSVVAYFLALNWGTVAYRSRRGFLPPIEGGTFDRAALRDALLRLEMRGGLLEASRGLDGLDAQLPLVARVEVERPCFERDTDARRANVALGLYLSGSDAAPEGSEVLGEHEGRAILGWKPRGCRQRLTLHLTDALAVVLGVVQAEVPAEVERSRRQLAQLLRLVGDPKARGRLAADWPKRLAGDARWIRTLPAFLLGLDVAAGRDGRARTLLALAVRRRMLDTGEDDATVAARARLAPAVVLGARAGDAAVPLPELGRVAAALGLPRRQLARRLGPGAWRILDPHVPLLRRRKAVSDAGPAVSSQGSVTP